MKLLPKSEFNAGLFVEAMGDVHTEYDAQSFRLFLLDAGYRDTDRIGDNLWSILLETWADEVGWQEA